VLSKLSGGVFDCAIADKLVALGLLPDLGFTAQTGVDDALRHTPALQFRGRRVAKRRVALFDLGGVAKGYAVDRATAVLRTHGVLAGLVNAGGDLRHFGREASLVRVRDPEHPTKIAGAVSLKDGALATSATRPLAGAPGPEISPIYDTSLNQPHPFGQGATVCAPSCLLADALTKVVLGAGPEAQALLERLGAQSVSFEAPA
jgi:thiamine biosynthesis lipoprotein